MSRPAWFVGPWDLNRRLACVPDDPSAGTVVLVESVAKSTALPFHRQKLVLVLSAMRHFAAELRDDGFDVEVVRAPTYVEGVAAHVAARGSSEVHALLPREWGLLEALRRADADGALGAPLTLHDDGGPGGHFLLSRAEFEGWAEGRKTWRMDHFYQWMRKRTGVLLDPAGKPVGGRWSTDSDNRRTPPPGERPPDLPRFEPDPLTRAVMDEVKGWGIGWGRLEGFAWPVTRRDARRALDAFFAQRFARFGDYQDAMVTGAPFLWHACVSPALNLGLLHPQELIDGALRAWDGGAPLNAVEGFIRQVLGWREFMRGMYWRRMPGLRAANRFDARRPLPRFYWEPDQTDMACVREAVTAVRDHGYAHHIQRLMVLGNLGLLVGVAPPAVSHWFWAAFVDAYEWVELPNVHGMALAADPTFTTKPYAASGSYIHKMSDHCRGCRYDPKARVGEHACPFNSLFWDFMARHRDELSTNPRVGMLYRSWDRWDDDQRQAIRARAGDLIASWGPLEAGWTFHDDQG